MESLNKMNKSKEFIILSSCGFGEILQRMHHISKSLVKLGHSVKYISPSVNVKISNRVFDVSTIISYIVQNKQITDGVEIYQSLKIFYNDEYLGDSYSSLIQYLINSSNKEIVIVSYMPYQVNNIKELKGDFKVIYECVDDHTDTEYAYWGNKMDILYEQDLMDLCDGITATATSLYLQRISIEGRENTYLSRNAVNEIDFKIDNSYIPEDLVNIPEPRIIYSGAVYQWFDKELFYDVVKENKDKSFIIVGFGSDEILNEKYDNLYFLGAKKHNELKYYLKNCNVGIIPFKEDTDLIINCDPIKQYEYLACGLPVVATYIPETVINKPYIFNADNKDDFTEAINKALAINIDHKVINEFINNNSWTNRAKLLCDIADNIIKKDETEILLNNIEASLDNICNKYDNAIFKILKAMCLKIKDNEKFKLLSEEAYSINKNKFIEKQYINSLLSNKEYLKCINIIDKSKNINSEIIDEVKFIKENNELEMIEVLIQIVLNNIKKSIKLIGELNNEKIKSLYYFYIRKILGEEIKKVDLDIVKEFSNRPIYKFLNNENHKNVNIVSNNPFISVIIPTRNSASLLKYTLMTCIYQNYDNYEIIISDNSSPGNYETEKVVKELNCNKIKYYRTPKEYTITENYEYAYSKSNGEYMLILGSDDGLLLHCLEKLSFVIKELNYPLSISWDLIAYGWPKAAINSMKNGMFIPYLASVERINYVYYTEEVLKKVLNFELRYSYLPMFYYNSIIKRELAEELKSLTGEVFAYNQPPDIYTGLAFAYLQKKYIHINVPMTIGGTSEKSIGISSVKAIYDFNEKNKKDNFELKEFRDGISIYEKMNIPVFSGEEGSVLEAAIYAKKVFEKYGYNLEVNLEKFYKSCIKYLINDDDLKIKMDHFKLCLDEYGDKDLIKWFDDNFINNSNFNGYDNYEKYPLAIGYKENGSLVLDTSKFSITDVFGAAVLYRNILGY